NRRFQNLFEIWLEGDHYKWRAMRANGIAEKYCTGNGDPYEKFAAWARTVPATLRNPLYHWTHLELKRYFGMDELLDERSAPRVWEQANALLATPELSAQGILSKFRVRAACRPWFEPRLRGFPDRAPGRLHLRPRPQRARRHPPGTLPVRFAYDAGLRAVRRGEGLDQADAPGRAAQQQYSALPRNRPGR